MTIGYFLCVGDKTTCGGGIITGCSNHLLNGLPTARTGDKYICGKDNGIYQIAGGQPNYLIQGTPAAGTIHSIGTCSCKCRFINSFFNVTYNDKSKDLPAPKQIINSAISVTTQNVLKPLIVEPKSSTPVEEGKQPRESVDAGFCVLKDGTTPASYESWLFIDPPVGSVELYRKLNPDKKKQPGSILIVVDPEKQDAKQLEKLQNARDRIDTALAPLTPEEAKVLYRNRMAIDIFSSQVFSEELGKAGDVLGYVSEVGNRYYEEINILLKEIQVLYQATYSNNNGMISGQEFFGQRARLFSKLDAVLNKYSKTQLNLKEYNDIKKSLGLSTRSIMHKWDQAGINNIEGYANYIEKSAKLIKIMKKVGYIGVGLDFTSYTTNVYDACAKGRENECRKAAITEYSKFGGKQLAGITAGSVAGFASRGACMWFLGLSTAEVGGIGSALCLVTGLGFSIGAAKLAEDIGENLGGHGGDIIYEHYIE